MAIDYPDYMSEVAEASERYEVDGVQYVVSLQPQTIAPGERAELAFVLQSAVNVPVDFSIKLTLPTGRRNRPCQMSVAEEEVTVTLEEAQVGELRLPIRCEPETVPAIYEIKLELKGRAQARGQRIRPNKGKGRLKAAIIRNVLGLKLAPIVGVDFKASKGNRQTFKLTVEGEPVPGAEVDLSSSFTSLWKAEELPLQQKAMQEMNERRIYIVPELTPPVVYISLLNEARKRFLGTDLDLRLGEAIFMSKILTFTTLYFLQQEAAQDGLLVPMFQRTLELDQPFENALVLVARFGYAHLTRLAIAVSFGLLEDAVNERLWTVEEQVGVNEFIVNQLETGQILPVEFMYLPLLFGGLLVAREVVMEGEDLNHSLQALAQAKQDRMAEFPEDDEELKKIFTLFDELLELQMR